MGLSPQRNLVFVTIDAWRADFVDSYDGIPLTPNLAALAKHTARFDHAYANGPWTSPPLISVFTGESPAAHQVHYEWSIPKPGTLGMAQVFAEAGYEVPNLCYLNRVGNYQNLGYKQEETPDYPKGPTDDLLLPALQKRRQSERPFFLWYHYKYVHLPYFPSAPYRQALGIQDGDIPGRLIDTVCKLFVVQKADFPLQRQDAALVRRLYAGNVLQMDAWLGSILTEITTSPDWDHTTLVVSADHGDELLEHGHVGHASTAEHATLFQEVLRIPLLVVDRRIQNGPLRITTPIQSLDFFPTLLSLAGVKAPPCRAARDLSLLALGTGDPKTPPPPFLFQSARKGYRTERALAEHRIEGFLSPCGRRKVIHERYDTESVQIYNLETDPGEVQPIVHSPQSPEGQEALLELDTLRRSLSDPAVAD